MTTWTVVALVGSTLTFVLSLLTLKIVRFNRYLRGELARAARALGAANATLVAAHAALAAHLKLDPARAADPHSVLDPRDPVAAAFFRIDAHLCPDHTARCARR